MLQYINNLVPRLKDFSASLDKIEIFVDKPWVIVDDNQNIQKFIFKRNGELVMSLNGQVTIGKWEFLSYAKSLLIDRIEDKILLNQKFIDPAVMILKKENLFDENLILANEGLLPDLNVINYLKGLYYQKLRIRTVKLKTGELLEVHYYEPGYYEYMNKNVSISCSSVPDGNYQTEDSKGTFIIKNNTISRFLVYKGYKTNYGLIIIEQEFERFKLGDRVFQNNKIAPDLKYRLGFMNHIIVKDGKIISF